MQKMNLDLDLTPFTKINSKWSINFKVKRKAVKLIEGNIGGNLDDLGYGNDFLDTTPKAQSLKEIINKLDFTKIKTSALQKAM